MLHDVIILVHFSILSTKTITNHSKNMFFHIFFPPEGNFDIDAGDGGGGGGWWGGI